MSNFRQWPISKIYSMSNFRQWPSSDNHSSFLISRLARLLPNPFFIPHFPHSSHQNLGVGSVRSVTSFFYKPIICACTRVRVDDTYWKVREWDILKSVSRRKRLGHETNFTIQPLECDTCVKCPTGCYNMGTHVATTPGEKHQITWKQPKLVFSFSFPF